MRFISHFPNTLQLVYICIFLRNRIRGKTKYNSAIAIITKTYFRGIVKILDLTAKFDYCRNVYMRPLSLYDGFTVVVRSVLALAHK